MDFNLNWVGGLATGLLVVAVTIGVTLLILDNFAEKANTSGNYESYKAYNDIKAIVIDLVSWLGIIVLVVIAVVVLFYVRSLGAGSR
jgi:hypothetical protein